LQECYKNQYDYLLEQLPVFNGVYIPEKKKNFGTCILFRKDLFELESSGYLWYSANPTVPSPAFKEICDEADAAIAFIEWPHTGRGTNGPISLQYSDYTRDGKTVHASNIRDMEMVQDLRKSLGHRPLIVSVRAETPMVFTEVEPYADAILMEARITRQAVMEVLSGRHLPGGRLPFQLPASMETVENQKEDTAFDMDCYHDSDGNVYNFGFGL